MDGLEIIMLSKVSKLKSIACSCSFVGSGLKMMMMMIRIMGYESERGDQRDIGGRKKRIQRGHT
jgi:hypothetical protein